MSSRKYQSMNGGAHMVDDVDVAQLLRAKPKPFKRPDYDQQFHVFKSKSRTTPSRSEGKRHRTRSKSSESRRGPAAVRKSSAAKSTTSSKASEPASIAYDSSGKKSIRQLVTNHLRRKRNTRTTTNIDETRGYEASSDEEQTPSVDDPSTLMGVTVEQLMSAAKVKAFQETRTQQKKEHVRKLLLRTLDDKPQRKSSIATPEETKTSFLFNAVDFLCDHVCSTKKDMCRPLSFDDEDSLAAGTAREEEEDESFYTGTGTDFTGSVYTGTDVTNSLDEDSIRTDFLHGGGIETSSLRTDFLHGDGIETDSLQTDFLHGDGIESMSAVSEAVLVPQKGQRTLSFQAVQNKAKNWTTKKFNSYLDTVDRLINMTGEETDDGGTTGTGEDCSDVGLSTASSSSSDADSEDSPLAREPQGRDTDSGRFEC